MEKRFKRVVKKTKEPILSGIFIFMMYMIFTYFLVGYSAYKLGGDGISWVWIIGTLIIFILSQIKKREIYLEEEKL